jgi:protein-disulfide isomerase
MSARPTPTKRELRERRRAERIAAERAEAAASVRRRRTWRLLAAAGLAACVVAVAAVASSSGGAKPATAPVAKSTLFAGLPEHNGVLGNPKAPLTVTEYVDLQCPICAVASHDTLPALVRDYVRTGKVKLQLRTLQFIGPDSQVAARFAFGAERQGRLWPFLESFYAAQGQENSGYVTAGFLRSVASAAGVDAAAAQRVADSAAAQDALNTANSDAQALGVNATPTFTVARGSGPAHVLAGGNHDIASLSSALDAQLAR